MKFKVGDVIQYNMRNHSSNEQFIDGEYYTVSDIDKDGDPIIEFDDGELHAEYACYFTLISGNTLEYALSLVGKTVKFINDQERSIKVEAVGMRNKFNVSRVDTPTIKQNVVKSGYCIVLQYGRGAENLVALDEIRVIDNTIRLTDTCVTQIEGNHVKIGHLTIPIDKIQEILDVYNQNR